MAITNLRCVIAFASLLIFYSQLEATRFHPAQQKTSSEIGVRNAHAMAYDSGRGRVVLFGGADASRVCGDTWEWNGRRWTQVSVTGPGPRTFAAMTYDSVRRRVVLFGGNRVLFGKTPEDNVYLDDTWEWDGQSWAQIKASGPPGRAEAVMAFDSRRSRVVLFGGHTRVAGERRWFGDTWEWDGMNWTQINAIGPSPRNGAAAVYDSTRGKIVLFGGSSGVVSAETWEWDGNRWTENIAAVTQGRFNCVMAYDKARRKITRFGGRYGGKPFGDTWEYDGRLWKQLSTTGPAARNHSAMVYDSTRRKIVLFGGHDLGSHDDAFVFGDTWEWDGFKWLKRDGVPPQKRIENGH